VNIIFKVALFYLGKKIRINLFTKVNYHELNFI
jgi:hypothetical protein